MASPGSLARNESQASSRRSTSLGSRLFRSKSGEALGDRKSSGRLKKLKQAEMDEQAKVTQSPPRLPGYTPQPLGIQSFGGENYSPNAHSRDYANGTKHAPPVPPLPGNLNKDAVDPYARTESMTHRKSMIFSMRLILADSLWLQAADIHMRPPSSPPSIPLDEFAVVKIPLPTTFL